MWNGIVVSIPLISGNSGPATAGQSEANHLGEGSTTISKESTLQANGGGNGGPLAGNAEGEDIVWSI